MSQVWKLAAIVLLTAGVTGCAETTMAVPPGTVEADRFLFERGEAAVKERKWADAREYFRNIVDNYPQSTFRPDAKLALGDAYLSDGSTESLLLSAQEFREFQTFYPTHPRADYAQLQLARTFVEQMLAPERDQTATREAVKEMEVFFERYPNSSLMSEARELEREAKDRLSQSGYLIGYFYYRAEWYAGAIDRFREVLAADPEFTRRDALYYHLAESLYQTDKKPEALPYYERLVSEFESSEYLLDTQKRIAELKGGDPAGK